MADGGEGKPILFEETVDGLEARAVGGRGSDCLAVVFSQVRVPAGSFGLSRLFARTRHACLFLNQPSNAWYREADHAVDDLVARAASATGASRVVFYGSSMGAWGAVAAASRRPDARAIVFAPDHRIGEPGSQSAAAGLSIRQGEPSLTDLLSVPRTGRVDVVEGLFDPYDAGVAARLVAAPLPPAVRVVPLLSSHEVHDHLYTVNVIRRVIAGFSRDIAEEAASRGLLASAPDWTRLSAFADLAARCRAGGTVDPEAVRSLDLPDNPGAAMLKAELLEGAGRLAEAADVLAGLADRIAASGRLSSLPKRYLKEIPRRRIRLLVRLGDLDQAERVRAEACRAYPTDAGFAAGGTRPATVAEAADPAST